MRISDLSSDVCSSDLLFNPSGLCHVAMMEWKPVLLPVFLAAGLVITGVSTPASADQGRGGWGRNDQPRGDIKPRRYEQDAARRAMLDGQVLPFSILKRRVEREMDGANYLGSEFDNRRGESRSTYMREGRIVWVAVDVRSSDNVRTRKRAVEGKRRSGRLD